MLLKDLERLEDVLGEALLIIRKLRRAELGLSEAQLEQRKAAIKKRYSKSTEITEVRSVVEAKIPTEVVPSVEIAVPELSPPLVPPNAIQFLIGSYVANWQLAKNVKARPNTIKCIGVFKAMLKERSANEINELLQVYCQMKDPWFETKEHDIGTFAENIGKVALARERGVERPRGEKHWTEIVAERETEGKNDLTGIRPPNR